MASCRATCEARAAKKRDTKASHAPRCCSVVRPRNTSRTNSSSTNGSGRCFFFFRAAAVSFRKPVGVCVRESKAERSAQARATDAVATARLRRVPDVVDENAVNDSSVRSVRPLAAVSARAASRSRIACGVTVRMLSADMGGMAMGGGCAVVLSRVMSRVRRCRPRGSLVRSGRVLPLPLHQRHKRAQRPSAAQAGPARHKRAQRGF